MYKLTLLFLLPISLLAQTKSVLFIGNSYTSVNNLPLMTKNLALSLDDTLTVDSNTPGGTTFNSHTNNATSLSKIGQGTWDYVVLQAQSQEPSFPPSQVASQTYPYASVLVDSILSANECTIPLFYMTWGRQNGDASNCAAYAAICTYDGMQSRLRESYLEMALDNEAEVSPVGAAWKYVRDNHPTINLYNADESHPSAAGSYLAACVHYASIFKKSPIGASYTYSLNTSDAAILQNAAKLIVIDSLDTWNFRTNIIESDFTSISTTGAAFQFTNTSQNATDYFWDFGDGITSTLENPIHNYNQAGYFDVTLVATNSCTSDTSIQEVNPVVESIEEQNPNNFFVGYLDNQFTLHFKNSVATNIYIYNVHGQLLQHKQSTNQIVQISKSLASGVYFISVSSLNGTNTIIKKVTIN